MQLSTKIKSTDCIKIEVQPAITNSLAVNIEYGKAPYKLEYRNSIDPESFIQILPSDTSSFSVDILGAAPPNNYSFKLISLIDSNNCLATSDNLNNFQVELAVFSRPEKPLIVPSGSIAMCEGELTKLTASGDYPVYQWSNNEVGTSFDADVTGNYSVKVINDNGCESVWSDPVSIIVYTRPTIPNVSQNGDVLTSSADFGNQWFFNGDLIPGATEQNYKVNASGDYYVMVTNNFSCSSRSDILSVDLTNLPVNEILNLEIYPNPTSNTFKIIVKTQEFNELNYSLLDINGRSLLMNRILTDITIISIEEFVSGIYFLHLNDGDIHLKAYKIIKN